MGFSSLCLLTAFACAARVCALGLGRVARRQLRQPAPAAVPLPGAKAYRFFLALGVVLGLGALAAGARTGAVSALAVAPVGFQLLWQGCSRRWWGQFDASGILYFHALRALVHSGLGFSAALDRLARSQATPFARAMRDHLAEFETGSGFLRCLDQFPNSHALPALGVSLRSLALAYRQGLALGPLLDQIVPALERDREEGCRTSQSRRSVLAQAAVAFVVPWVVWAALQGWGAELGMRPSLSGVGLALVWEGLGVWCLWKLSAFH